MNIYLIYFFLAILPIKVILTYIRWGVYIDTLHKTIIFQNAITRSLIRNTDIKEWGFRTIDEDRGRSSRYFECRLQNNKTYIYPVRDGARVLKYKIEDFREVLGSEPKEYTKLTGWKRELNQYKFTFWILYSI